jgi:hypothetical protein
VRPWAHLRALEAHYGAVEAHTGTLEAYRPVMHIGKSPRIRIRLKSLMRIRIEGKNQIRIRGSATLVTANTVTTFVSLAFLTFWGGLDLFEYFSILRFYLTY